MELRKDPITRSWVITGDDVPDSARIAGPCPFCPDSKAQQQVITSFSGIDGAPWSARAVVHPNALYHIEGDPARRGDGIYDRMRPVGAHEVLLETSHHDRPLWVASDSSIEQFLRLVAQRIQDLKKDKRFKYISIFKNYGISAGQEFDHPHFQLTATTFVPRRVLYELRAGRDYFQAKERCVFCDIIAQEERQNLRVIESRGDYVALCPYAPRVPYEAWILPRTHEASFERTGFSKSAGFADLGALLRRTLQRIRTVTEEFHLVLHTSPNSRYGAETLGYWKTLDDDYHWHIEILPIIGAKAKSYTFKEVYYSPLSSETAVKRLSEAKIEP
jgi:UDPglucose--hexose-1-phosphate uridylyltransferase